MRKNHVFLILTLFLCTVSCISIKKQTYFQGEITQSTTDSFSNPMKNYLLRPGDVLYIKIISIDPRLSTFFNTDQGANTAIQSTAANLYIQGYVVNDSGYVELPILGSFLVNGKTMAQFHSSLAIAVDLMVPTSTVIVKMASYKITVSGEVIKPGLVYFSNERVSLIEALTSAGDLTLYGKRSNIQIIRQKIDGTYEKGIVNLNDVNVINSPWFYLQPNDVVYVSPTNTLAAKTNTANLTLAFAGISSLLLILSFISK
jgi:polysaccharide export outer membrane protein